MRLTPPKIPTPLAQVRCMAKVHPDVLYYTEEKKGEEGAREGTAGHQREPPREMPRRPTQWQRRPGSALGSGSIPGLEIHAADDDGQRPGPRWREARAEGRGQRARGRGTGATPPGQPISQVPGRLLALTCKWDGADTMGRLTVASSQALALSLSSLVDGARPRSLVLRVPPGKRQQVINAGLRARGPTTPTANDTHTLRGPIGRVDCTSPTGEIAVADRLHETGPSQATGPRSSPGARDLDLRRGVTGSKCQ